MIHSNSSSSYGSVRRASARARSSTLEGRAAGGLKLLAELGSRRSASSVGLELPDLARPCATIASAIWSQVETCDAAQLVWREELLEELAA